MKKYFSLICLIFIGIAFPVNATNYETKTLIPVDTEATVNTELLSYENFIYHSMGDDKGNCEIEFGSVTNNTDDKIPVSINLLLFNSSKKNIGYVTYCTERDVDSDFTGRLLQPHESLPFKITVSRRYVDGDYNAYETKYIAVLDENKYCQVGGYRNYVGQTLEEILAGKENNNKTNAEIFENIYSFLKDNGIIYYAVLAVIILVVFAITGGIINFFHRKIYGKPTKLAYIPIFNMFVIIKMAFGGIVGAVYLGLLLLGSFLAVIGQPGFLKVLTFIEIIALLIVIIKVITKKYDLFLLEPRMHRSNPVGSGGDFRDLAAYNSTPEGQNNNANSINNNDNNFQDFQDLYQPEPTPLTMERKEPKQKKSLFSLFKKPDNMMSLNKNNENNGDGFVDLNYDNGFSNNNETLDDDNSIQISQGSDNSFNDNLDLDLNSNDNDDNDNGESDIFKFFN